MADENNGRRIRDEPGVGPNGSGPHPWCKKLKVKCLQRSFFFFKDTQNLVSVEFADLRHKGDYSKTTKSQMGKITLRRGR